MSIREYTLSKDGTRQLSPSFKVREFACTGSDTVKLDDELVVLLQCIREHFGKPVQPALAGQSRRLLGGGRAGCHRGRLRREAAA